MTKAPPGGGARRDGAGCGRVGSMKYTKRAMLFALGSVGSLATLAIPGMNPTVAETVAVRGFIICFALFLISGSIDLVRFIRDKLRERAHADGRFQ
jgi:hypothetical protein